MGVAYSTQLAAQANQAKAKKTFKEIIPGPYWDFAKVFLEVKSEHLPEHKPWDYTINMKLGVPETLCTKVYPMLLNKQAELGKFLNENLQKGYIVPSKSPLASPILFIKKKNDKLHMVEDYCNK